MRITSYSETELLDVERIVTRNIHFLDHRIYVDKKLTDFAENLIADTDPADIPFVALTISLNATLWTGDKKLINCFNRKNFTAFCTTAHLIS